jgi:NADH-quinone oxidoreductase subunit J
MTDPGIYWPTLFFWLFGSLACAFAIAVVLTNNIVRMAFYLVLSLASTAGLFFLAGADFVGAMQIMIYVGGTLVLLVFGVMLTSQTPFISIKTRAGEWVLAAIVGGSLLALLLWAAIVVDDWQGLDRAQAEALEIRPTATRIGLDLLGAPVDRLQRSSQQESAPALDRLGRGMCGYLLAFEIVSVHLLIVLVGAAYLARTRRKGG